MVLSFQYMFVCVPLFMYVCHHTLISQLVFFNNRSRKHLLVVISHWIYLLWSYFFSISHISKLDCFKCVSALKFLLNRNFVCVGRDTY